MKKIIWALFDDRRGSVGQAKGIILKLSDHFDVVEKNIVYTKFAALPNWVRRSSLIGVNTKESSPLKGENFPDAVISVSRRTLPIALWIKKHSSGKTKIIQLMYPGKYGCDQIDLLVLSEHDRGKINMDNVFYITGSPHRIFPETLAENKIKWEPVFANLPKPWTMVVVGGSVKNKPVDPKNFELLAQRIVQLHDVVSGSILITSSRRTGKEAENILMEKINKAQIPAYTYLWGEEKENPIMGFYACADRIIATGDSVSMVCEACGTGKPVMIFQGKNWMTKKHQKFVQSLFDGKYAVDIEKLGAIDFIPEKKLNPAYEIAHKIENLLK